MKGFTLVEVLVAMLIFVTAVVFLIGAFISAQRAIIFAKHKQQAIFILQERIEQVKNSNWGTIADNGSITLNAMGSVTERIETIEYQTNPGTTALTVHNPGNLLTKIWEIDLLGTPGEVTDATTTEAVPYKLKMDILFNGSIPDKILGGTFTFISIWMEEGREVDVKFPAYLALKP